MSFSLLRPAHLDVYTILPPHSHASIAVEYAVYGSTSSRSYMCLEVIRRDFDSNSENVYIPKSCMDIQHTSFTLNSLVPGSYTLIMHLREENMDLLMTEVRRSFEVRDITSSLPSLRVHDISVVADKYTNKSDIPIAFSVAESSLSHLFTVCIDVENSYMVHLLSSCLDSTSNSIPTSFTLYGLEVGEYSVTLTLALRNSPFTRYETTAMSHHVSVIPLSGALPAISVPPVTEAVLPREEEAVDVAIAYHLSHVDSYVLRHLQLCVDVDDALIACSSSVSGAVTLPHLSRGEHSYTLQLQLAEEDAIIATSSCSGRVVIDVMSTFLPTYEWQQVHAWQSIPPGLLTRYFCL